MEFKRKHTANVHESLNDLRRIVENPVENRDQRRDAFACVIKKAMETTLGGDADEVLKVLSQQGITRTLAKQAIDIARERLVFTVFAVGDALTRLSGKLAHAGDRAEADERARRVLAVAA